jgi:ABC-type enterochelin transport system permease subunit
MVRLHDTVWVYVAVGLSIVVVAVGWPVFQRKFGSPASLLWTLGVVGGVWFTYLIRAWAWSSRGQAPPAVEGEGRKGS